MRALAGRKSKACIAMRGVYDSVPLQHSALPLLPYLSSAINTRCGLCAFMCPQTDCLSYILHEKAKIIERPRNAGSAAVQLPKSTGRLAENNKLLGMV